MRPIIRTIARALFRAGGFGLLTLGAFNSSPLVVPMGNDLLVLAVHDFTMAESSRPGQAGTGSLPHGGCGPD